MRFFGYAGSTPIEKTLEKFDIGRERRLPLRVIGPALFGPVQRKETQHRLDVAGSRLFRKPTLAGFPYRHRSACAVGLFDSIFRSSVSRAIEELLRAPLGRPLGFPLWPG
jgi:hypothetical protein